jgi:hypothetical protein
MAKSDNQGKAGSAAPDNTGGANNGQSIEQARENGRLGAQKAAEMRARGELPADNGAGTMKDDDVQDTSKSNRK